MSHDAKDAELFRYMLGIAKAHGFECLTDAIAQAAKARGVPTLRDTFAAAALTGLMANPSTSGLLPDASKAHSLAARIAYASADAMLAAREGK